MQGFKPSPAKSQWLFEGQKQTRLARGWARANPYGHFPTAADEHCITWPEISSW